MSSQGLQLAVLDLFCGAGGMSLGFEMAGCRIGLGVEKERFACDTHRHNFGGRCHLGDIREIADPESFCRGYGLDQIDLVIGGPPCQGFARVGRGKLRSLRRDPAYIHDPRNEYYTEFLRFVEALQPTYFVMENVPDMQHYADEEGLLLGKVVLCFRSLGYTVDSAVLRADHYGVPQTRRRLFIVGSRSKRQLRWPTKTHEDKPVTVWEAIGDLPIVPHGHREDEIAYRPRCELNDHQSLMREGAGDLLYNHQTRWHNEQDLAAGRWEIRRTAGRIQTLSGRHLQGQVPQAVSRPAIVDY